MNLNVFKKLSWFLLFTPKQYASVTRTLLMFITHEWFKLKPHKLVEYQHLNGYTTTSISYRGMFYLRLFCALVQALKLCLSKFDKLIFFPMSEYKHTAYIEHIKQKIGHIFYELPAHAPCVLVYTLRSSRKSHKIVNTTNLESACISHLARDSQLF